MKNRVYDPRRNGGGLVGSISASWQEENANYSNKTKVTATDSTKVAYSERDMILERPSGSWRTAPRTTSGDDVTEVDGDSDVFRLLKHHSINKNTQPQEKDDRGERGTQLSHKLRLQGAGKSVSMCPGNTDTESHQKQRRSSGVSLVLKHMMPSKSKKKDSNNKSSSSSSKVKVPKLGEKKGDTAHRRTKSSGTSGSHRGARSTTLAPVGKESTVLEVNDIGIDEELPWESNSSNHKSSRRIRNKEGMVTRRRQHSVDAREHRRERRARTRSTLSPTRRRFDDDLAIDKGAFNDSNKLLSKVPEVQTARETLKALKLQGHSENPFHGPKDKKDRISFHGSFGDLANTKSAFVVQQDRSERSQSTHTSTSGSNHKVSRSKSKSSHMRRKGSTEHQSMVHPGESQRERSRSTKDISLQGKMNDSMDVTASRRAIMKDKSMSRHSSTTSGRRSKPHSQMKSTSDRTHSFRRSDSPVRNHQQATSKSPAALSASERIQSCRVARTTLVESSQQHRALAASAHLRGPGVLTRQDPMTAALLAAKSKGGSMRESRNVGVSTFREHSQTIPNVAVENTEELQERLEYGIHAMSLRLQGNAAVTHDSNSKEKEGMLSLSEEVEKSHNVSVLSSNTSTKKHSKVERSSKMSSSCRSPSIRRKKAVVDATIARPHNKVMSTSDRSHSVRMKTKNADATSKNGDKVVPARPDKKIARKKSTSNREKKSLESMTIQEKRENKLSSSFSPSPQFAEQDPAKTSATKLDHEKSLRPRGHQHSSRTTHVVKTQETFKKAQSHNFPSMKMLDDYNDELDSQSLHSSSAQEVKNRPTSLRLGGLLGSTDLDFDGRVPSSLNPVEVKSILDSKKAATDIMLNKKKMEDSELHHHARSDEQTHHNDMKNESGFQSYSWGTRDFDMDSWLQRNAKDAVASTTNS